MILDASAGNRTMWKYKHSDNIIYIDMTTELQRKPTIFCNNQQTPFKDKIFDTIFYDPPHSWGQKDHYHNYPASTKEYVEKYKDKAVPRYYGWNIYKNRSLLIVHIYHAQEEFKRILKDDGLLWLKWNEMSIPLSNVLTVFSQWRMLMRLYIKSPLQTAGKHQTYWICIEKKLEGKKQILLL